MSRKFLPSIISARQVKSSILLAILISSLVSIATHAWGESALYHYDPLGRLELVEKGTQVVIYRYDPEGNLLSVVNTSTTSGSPVISSITPDVLFVGTSSQVTITGQNLLGTESVLAEGGQVEIKNIIITDTSITAEMTALSPGPETIRVKTFYGNPDSDGIGVTLSSSKFTLKPSPLAILPGSSGTITASISPPLDRDLTVNLQNSAPSIVNVPSSITIPVSGSVDFPVEGLMEGVATISAGSPNSVVFVTGPFVGDASGLSSKGVSVYIDAPLAGQSPVASNPVGVYITPPETGTSSAVARPVSIYVETPTIGTSPTVAKPVSIYIEPPTVGDSPIVTNPISVEIQP